jgi:hypothetical protein
MDHLITEYLEYEFGFVVNNLVELNSNDSNGAYVLYSVTYIDRHGFEQCSEYKINVWKVLAFINNKINNI